MSFAEFKKEAEALGMSTKETKEYVMKRMAEVEREKERERERERRRKRERKGGRERERRRKRERKNELGKESESSMRWTCNVWL